MSEGTRERVVNRLVEQVVRQATQAQVLSHGLFSGLTHIVHQ